MSEVSPAGAAPEKNGFSRVPVMSCAEAKAFEKAFFSRAEMTEEAAMRAAGTAVGAGVLRECAGADFSRLAVLAGKGHNGGDAVRAATRIFAEKKCRVLLVFFAAENAGGLAPLTRKFLEEFLAAVPADMRRVVFLPESAAALPPEVPAFVAAPHVLLDGVFGHSFRPPFPPRALAFLREILAARAENSPCCSVDLPSGLSDAGAECCPLRADFTFPTGILKRPLLDFPEAAGRVVPADIGFSGFDETSVAAADPADFLRKIFAPRPALCDKRAFGHALIVGGSRGMPGALMLNALAALRAGTGLVSVICPESVQPAFAARAPGAMWIPCRENADGGPDCGAAFSAAEKMFPRVSIVLCGSGMGVSAGARELILKIAAGAPRETPLVLDADALRPETLAALRERGAPAGKTVLLPHAGEFARMGGNGADALGFCREHALSIALKGACTRAADPSGEILSFWGSPALARGGSGDVLAGTVAALFAAERNFRAGAPARERIAAAVAWHGIASRLWAKAQGERCADIAALPEFLGAARAIA